MLDSANKHCTQLIVTYYFLCMFLTSAQPSVCVCVPYAPQADDTQCDLVTLHASSSSALLALQVVAVVVSV